MPLIEIVISPTGESTVQTHGYSGPSCREASQFIEAALGTPQDEQLTSEFYVTDLKTEAVQQEGQPTN